MSTELLLRAAYGANIVVLSPVVLSLVLTASPAGVFGATVPESAALRLLVASLWGAILLCSVAGLVAPRAFDAILLLQVVYKAAWLVLYVVPSWRAGGAGAVPWGPVVVFVAIVVAWPCLLLRLWHGGA